MAWYFTGLVIPGLRLRERSEADFADARRRAFLRRIGALLRRDPGSNRLLRFEQVKREFGAGGQVYLGMRSVPVSKIVGSVGRHRDFDRAFLPAKDHLRERWMRVDRMLRRRGTLPPVDLYKVGNGYFVLDGHHRVSVASYHGIEQVDARVVEFHRPSVPEARPPRTRLDARRNRAREREPERPARKVRALRSADATGWGR